MPYAGLKMRPGIDVEQTPLLNSSGFSYSVCVRFRDGLPEKIGGWNALNATALTGVCTGMHAWADLSSNNYIACGTDQRLELFYGGLLVDITPLRTTVNITPAFSTTAGSATVNVKDTSHGAAVGDWINIVVPVSVGGLILQGFYQVQTVVDADNFTITAADEATNTVSDGGAVPVFDATMSSADIQVTLDDHGLVAGSTFEVQVETIVGGVTIAAALYSVTAPVATNTFTISTGSAASSTATASENSGNARIEYLLPSGLQSSEYVSGSGGYGVGDYGAGDYGTGSSGTVLVPLREWFLDNFGEDLVGNYNGSPIYIWTPPVATGNVAIPIDTTNFPSAHSPPTQVNVSFVAAPQQMIIALGCDDPVTSDFDPNLVRWCNQGDYTDWVATSTNSAGSYRIPSGSMLVGGISAPNFTVIWTNVDMWLMSYLGGTGLSGLVWGFSKIGSSIDLLAPRACAVYSNRVYFMSSNGFFVFDGNAIDIVPCPVWDKLWKNLDRMQLDKVNMQVNSYFQEVSVSFASLTGDGNVDSRVTYNVRENSWTYDEAPTVTARTAWVDENVYGAMIGTDLNGYLQQHDIEGVYDANGDALAASVRTGWFSIQEGSLLSMMERIEGDLIANGGTGTIYLTVYAQDYATGPVRTYGPYAWVVGVGPPWRIVRARGRFMSIEVSSSELGIFWRLGDIRYRIQQAGKRP